jgi:pimeloyl-ACP methyl ester carboxylesterase
VSIHYRDAGEGSATLLFLHGGWGYEVYSFDAQIAALRRDFRIVIPDRSGYGRSMHANAWPADFHRRAAEETLRVLDALSIRQAVIWGHSDGAVIAALLGLAAPERVTALILEAFHYYRAKPGSREFFETMVQEPASLGERAVSEMAREHGAGYWEQLIEMNGRAWLKIADESKRPDDDLFGGRLRELCVPTLFIHGENDPRTEPGELGAVRAQLPNARFRIIEGAGHSPHSNLRYAEECNRIAIEFLLRR